MHFIVFRIFLKRLGSIFAMMRDKAVPKRKKLLVIFGFIYLFLPFDLIPPVLFPIAWVDDLIIWVWIIWHLRDTLDNYWKGKDTDLSKNFKGKDIIEDADYEVKE